MADLDRHDTDSVDKYDHDDVPAADKIELTRTEIEHTRGEMAETLNAIKDKQPAA